MSSLPRRPGPRVALALGSGGARGYAHLGVIRELRARGCEVVTVAGTSMGAVVGGLAAAGREEDFAAWASGLRQRDVLRLMDFKLSAPGAVAADRLLGAIGELFGDTDIADLPVPFTAVATDLGSRREVWFQRGPLLPAVRASIAIPGFFTPVMINGRLLVDGGLLNPVPIDPTTAVPSDLTVAVSLLGRRTHARQAPAQESSAPQRREEWRDRLRRTVASIAGREGADDPKDADEPADHKAPASAEAVEVVEPVEPVEPLLGIDPLPKDLRLTDVTGQAFEAMQGLVHRYRQAAFPADVTIDVPVDACRTLDFHRAAEMIDLGQELAARALDAAGLPVT
ncbi:patatin-like phospholipase family protein [Nocardioides zeae]|uniref:Patatin-like phospholipase family protein n=1 Tax=Nocardioides imazamoxiresistens TaxID=3231893 RepID=A0ABU3PXT1_9ACTN|nr:patatin-like phospholipase family protein [Nocardioides zeae]MDT9594048.1 patatin-like phospholipase family protein [Nocardioides zeae]